MKEIHDLMDKINKNSGELTDLESVGIKLSRKMENINAKVISAPTL